jgi:hypothetical protein
LKPFFFTALEINYIQNTEYSFARGSSFFIFFFGWCSIGRRYLFLCFFCLQGVVFMGRTVLYAALSFAF